MTAKEKAKELIEKYKIINYDLSDCVNHKEGAMIFVDEIIIEWNDYIKNYMFNQNNESKQLLFWQEVKTELEKL